MRIPFQGENRHLAVLIFAKELARSRWSPWASARALQFNLVIDVGLEAQMGRHSWCGLRGAKPPKLARKPDCHMIEGPITQISDQPRKGLESTADPRLGLHR
jgi:hypothetical protein